MAHFEDFESLTTGQLVTATDRLLHPPRRGPRGSAPVMPPPVIPTGVIVLPRLRVDTLRPPQAPSGKRLRLILVCALLLVCLAISLWIGYALPH